MITYSNLGNYGRFGNQLFQIASTIGIAIKNNQEFIFPKWEYSDYFLHKLPEEAEPSKHYEKITEYNTGYSGYYLHNNKNYDLVGYFQSYKYFEHCKDKIKYYFEFSNEPDLDNSVSVHVRRTDYLNLSHIHPVLSLDYYKKTTDFFKDENQIFKVFSDDIQWCKENFTWRYFEFINTGDLIEDFKIMKSCSSNIIANSSFSWWASYLNDSPNKLVISPKNYVLNESTDDRIPQEWIRL